MRVSHVDAPAPRLLAIKADLKLSRAAQTAFVESLSKKSKSKDEH
jgi:hypothetical protein